MLFEIDQVRALVGSVVTDIVEHQMKLQTAMDYHLAKMMARPKAPRSKMTNEDVVPVKTKREGHARKSVSAQEYYRNNPKAPAGTPDYYIQRLREECQATYFYPHNEDDVERWDAAYKNVKEVTTFFQAQVAVQNVRNWITGFCKPGGYNAGILKSFIETRDRLQAVSTVETPQTAQS
jgi:hypothetical protein